MMDLISIVDDDQSVRAATADLLTSAGFRCEAYASAEEYLASGRLADTSCLILDVNMPEMSGPQLRTRLEVLGYSTPVIFVTAFPEERARLQATDAGAVCCLAKPYSEAELFACVRSALAARETRAGKR